jgi:GT2 family glycosyltransferase
VNQVDSNTASHLPPQVLVVIANWEGTGDTIECLRSVYQSNNVQIQVLVVDNGSRDDSIQQITRIFPNIDLLALSPNQGFAGGFNAGIERALKSGAENIFVLSNDTIVEPDAIYALVNAPWDVSVPKILYYDDERIWAAGAKWRRFPPSVVMLGYGLLGQGEPDGPAWDSPGELDYATGCALLVRRRVFETVGGFDRNFECYMEDYDLCYRIRTSGYRIGYVPTARIYHKVSRTLGQNPARWWWYMGRNTVLFYRKDNRFPLWMLWAFLAWVFPREVIKGNLMHLSDFWRGIRDGFRFLKQKQSVHETDRATSVQG